jgi:hypothetical protein
MELDRRFAEQTEKDAPRSFEALGRFYGSLGWEDLLRRRRVVVLAEAGSGKSKEFELRAEALAKRGSAVFLRTVTEAAQRGFEASLRKSEAEALARWRASDRPAWFFLDSVDEAKGRRLDLGRSLASLADAIHGCERRAHVVLSGRPSDWEVTRDLAILNRELPIPEDPPPPEEIDPGQRALNILRGKSREATEPAERALVVAMAPLDDERVARFAKGKGVASADAFMEQLERQGLSRFARRPLDLNWLARQWRDVGSFGRLREMLERNLGQRLLETNESLRRDDGLSLDACNRALDRIGAAMVLRRVDSVAVPDSEADLDSKADALDVAELLPDWGAADRARLIGRAAFSPSRLGFVRLDNDNQGAVRSFLAARWLSGLLAAHCPRAKVHELLFADTHGVELVIPSMADTVAWLAISEPWVASETLRRDPWLLLERGDPASLPLDVRARALRAAMTAPDAQRFGRLPNLGALRRVAQQDMAPTIRTLWAELKEDDSSRQVIMQLVWLGSLRACADLAVEASFGAYADRTTEILSARALAAVGSDDEKRRYGGYLADNQSSVASEVFWDGVVELFPRHFGFDALLAALGDRALRARSSAQDLSRNVASLIPKLESNDQARALIELALSEIRQEDRGDEGHPLWEVAEACAEFLLASCAGRAEREPLAIAVHVESVAYHRHRPSGLTAQSERMRVALASTPENRRATLWTAAELLGWNSAQPGPPIRHPHQLDMAGVQIGLAPEDAKWLVADASARERDDDVRLAVNAAMRIARDAGGFAETAAALGAAAKARPGVAEELAKWTDPPPPPPADALISLQIQEMNEQAKRKADEFDASWRVFIEDLRARPQQLRTCRPPSAEGVDARLAQIWHLADRLRGTDGRFSEGDLEGLRPALGDELLAEFSDALSSQWRLWTPTPKAERAPEDQNRLGAADLIGLLGVSVEARSDPGWATRLTPQEATAATLYATLDINGFPDWLAQLSVAQPIAAREALLRCCFGDWRRDDRTPFQGVLYDLSRAGGAACELVSAEILERIASDPPPSLRVLEAAVRVAQLGRKGPRDIAATFIDLFEREAELDSRAIFIAAAFAERPDAACAALDETLDAIPPANRKALVRAAIPRIFGDDWSRGSIDTSAMPFSTLKRLADVAHREIAPREDPERTANEVFAPDSRDHAKTARSHALNALLARPGLATYQAIRSMISTGFPEDPIVMERWARDRAALDSERAPWTFADVESFERDHLAIPRTPRDLRTLAMHRFADLQAELIESDYGQGATLASLPDELAVQNWFAHEFKRGRKNSFSIEREPRVADEKEPDLRLEAKGSDAKLPIEIKVAESWSLKELEEALTVQLMGRYLRDPESKWGILLIAHQRPRPLGWKDEEGAFISIEQVVDRLSKRADDIAAQDPSAAQMAVALVDVSAKFDERFNSSP